MKTRDFLKMVTFAALAPVNLLAVGTPQETNPVVLRLRKIYPNDKIAWRRSIGSEDFSPRIQIRWNDHTVCNYSVEMLQELRAYHGSHVENEVIDALVVTTIRNIQVAKEIITNPW